MRSGVRDQPGQYGETLSLLKIQKISWAWWCAPVVPAAREAEAGELLEPRSWGKKRKPCKQEDSEMKYYKSVERQYYQPRILYLAKIILQK